MVQKHPGYEFGSLFRGNSHIFGYMFIYVGYSSQASPKSSPCLSHRSQATYLLLWSPRTPLSKKLGGSHMTSWALAVSSLYVGYFSRQLHSIQSQISISI